MKWQVFESYHLSEVILRVFFSHNSFPRGSSDQSHFYKPVEK